MPRRRIARSDLMKQEDWLQLSPDNFLGRWYLEVYGENAYGGGAGRVQAAMHRSLERKYSPATVFPRVLELGANIGEHVPFVKHGFSEYLLTDLRDDFEAAEREDFSGIGIRFEEADAEALPYRDATFDRVLHTCLLHHLRNPEEALKEIRRVLRPGGTADLFLSGDPGLLFRFGRWIGPYRAAARQELGQIKTLVDARDHRNHAWSLRRLIQHVFRTDAIEERSYPIRGAPMDLSLWRTFRIRRSIG